MSTRLFVNFRTLTKKDSTTFSNKRFNLINSTSDCINFNSLSKTETCRKNCNLQHFSFFASLTFFHLELSPPHFVVFGFLVGNGIYFKLQYLGISLGMPWIRKSNEKRDIHISPRKDPFQVLLLPSPARPTPTPTPPPYLPTMFSSAQRFGFLPVVLTYFQGLQEQGHNISAQTIIQLKVSAPALSEPLPPLPLSPYHPFLVIDSPDIRFRISHAENNRRKFHKFYSYKYISNRIYSIVLLSCVSCVLFFQKKKKTNKQIKLQGENVKFSKREFKKVFCKKQKNRLSGESSE